LRCAETGSGVDADIDRYVRAGGRAAVAVEIERPGRDVDRGIGGMALWPVDGQGSAAELHQRRSARVGERAIQRERAGVDLENPARDDKGRGEGGDARAGDYAPRDVDR